MGKKNDLKIVKAKKSDKSRFFFYIIAIGCLILFLLILLSSVLELGERLRNISMYLEIGFYVLVVLLTYLLIIRPIYIIVRSPSLSIVTTMDKMDSRAVAIYKKVAKNIVKSNDLPEEQKLLLTNYKQNEELLINLNFVFEKSVKRQLNGIIIKNAKIVLISTAICQSARVDMATVFAVNLRMIKQLVVKCGFRPSMKNLSKLTINVFSTALIAEGLENLTLNDVLPKTAMNSIEDIPFLGKVLESVAQGAANALLTVRIGCVARRYLFSDGNVVTQEDIRRNAYKETLVLIPQVIAGTVAFFPKKIVKFFSKFIKKDDTDFTPEELKEIEVIENAK